MFRFLHSSDLHLGKPFGRYPDELRGRLREARHESLGRLAAAARGGGAAHVLIAGDLFDAETPSVTVLRHALADMAAAADLTWVLLPGNHDSLAATELWQRLMRDCPANVRVAAEAVPMDLGGGVTLLAAPCPVRRPGRDLTDWMAEAARGEGPVIGLAHGGVTEFDASEEGNPAVIPPDRAERAGLDYLALGDWHGQMRIGPRQWYSGSPEADGFKHDTAAGALLVTVAGQGAQPQVVPVPTGRFSWRDCVLDLLPQDDPAAGLADLLAPMGSRRDTLLRLTPAGRVRPSSRAALERGFAAVAPDFAFAELRLDGLGLEHDLDDLDVIDRGGALRAAAEVLLAEATDPALPPADRSAASTALARLYGFAGDAP